MYILVWQVHGDKQNVYAFSLSKVSNTPHKNLCSFWTRKTPKQKDFYELYAIHKFGAKKNCTSE